MNHAASPRELQEAWANHHMHSMCDMLLFALGLAARERPEQVAQVLETVDGQQADRAWAKEAHDKAREAHRFAHEAYALMQEVKRQLEDVERRFDALEARETSKEADRDVIPHPSAARAG